MSQFKNHVGMVVDKFWKIIPKGHYAFKVNPIVMPVPHQHYLMLGMEVIKVCEEQGYRFEDKLHKSVDRDAWIRLLGAWVCYSRQRIEREGEMPSRNCIAQEMGLDAASLTNFLNARRPITMNGLKILTQFLGAKTLDIRPEMGASEVYSQDRKIKKNMLSIRSSLQSILDEMHKLEVSQENVSFTHVIERLEALKESVAA